MHRPLEHQVYIWKHGTTRQVILHLHVDGTVNAQQVWMDHWGTYHVSVCHIQLYPSIWLYVINSPGVSGAVKQKLGCHPCLCMTDMVCWLFMLLFGDMCTLCRYVSCVLGCPYEGEITPKAVADVSAAWWTPTCTTKLITVATVCDHLLVVVRHLC